MAVNMYRGILLDFYGTLVEDDWQVVLRIMEGVARTSSGTIDPAELAASWAERFAVLCSAAYGVDFRTQRDLAVESLRMLLEEHGNPLDPHELSEELFLYWSNPQPLTGVFDFFKTVQIPICVVSNIDEEDLEAAIGNLGWSFEFVVTSERARAYKPRVEPFEAGLSLLGCSPEAALHIGDSASSDLKGAAAAGIDVAWVNAKGRSIPKGIEVRPRFNVARVSELGAALS